MANTFVSPRLEDLYSRISNHIDRAQLHSQRAIDTESVKTCWLIGYEIVEEQKRQERAEEALALMSWNRREDFILLIKKITRVPTHCIGNSKCRSSILNCPGSCHIMRSFSHEFT